MLETADAFFALTDKRQMSGIPLGEGYSWLVKF
jgi:hypothetical protein